MTVTASKLTFYAGNKRLLRFTVVDKDAPGDPPLDLTTLTIKWALSRFKNGRYLSTPILEKSTTGGGIVKIDAINGILEVTLLRADTASLLGDFWQELEVTDVGGECEVVAVGPVSVLLNVVNA